MSLIGVSVKALNAKLVVFFTFLFLDIFLSTFIEYSLSKNLEERASKSILYAFFALQLSATGLLIISFFVMMWSTFLLRFGLIGILLKNFKITISMLVIYLVLFLVERSYLFIECFQNMATCDSTAWSNGLYIFFYYARHICVVPFYFFLTYGVLRLASPEYYKPQKWLKK